jgi:hypothetical protein
VIKLILFLSLIKGIIWVLYVPLWHFPDEQAHFGHVAYLAEDGPLPMGRTNDLNQEIAIAEQRLGTYRNKYGNNDFTYRPEYNLEYTDSYTGKYEEEIKTLPLNLRKEYKDPESAYYPHFFYRLSGLIYKLFYTSDLFVRVFSLRLFWLLTHLLLVYLAYQIGKIIFPKNQLAASSVAVLTSFQPMLTFVSAGVTNDNLHNLLFTAVIFFCLKLNQKIRWLDLSALALILYLGFLNKPQFLIALGIVAPVLFWQMFKQKRYKLIGFIAAAGLGLGWFVTQGRIPYFETRGAGLARPDYTLWQHLIYTFEHTLREVLPWYWGVFRWLSLTLPRWTNQLMMRLLVVVGIGLAIKFWRRKFEPGFWLILWSALIYFLALFFWDWQQVRSAGFPFGIQGRYYFPVIVTHMILLVLGIKAIWGKLLIILNYWFMILNWIALYWLTASYYDTGSLKIFIIQASQYKPFFAKGWWLILALTLYLIVFIIFSVQFYKLSRHEK